jgi:hypothetical protein
MKNTLSESVIDVTRKCESTFLGEEIIAYSMPRIDITNKTPKNTERR